MHRTSTAYQARRHPFLFGVALLLLGPYILAFALLFVIFFVIAAVLDVAGGGGRR